MQTEQRARAAREARELVTRGGRAFEVSAQLVNARLRTLGEAIVFAMEVGESAETEAMEAVGSALGDVLAAVRTHAADATAWMDGLLLGYVKGKGE